MAAVKPPWGYLASVPVTIRKEGWEFFQDSGDISPVLLVEMIPETFPSSKGPWAAWEGAGALRRDFWEADVVHLG